MTTGKSHFKHRARENSGNRTLNLDGLVFTFFFGFLVPVEIITTSPATSTASSAKISWLGDN
ncbi:hypothetical protein OAF13_02125 [Akkermansiaceae bacterium]|nr:hypothetical protein [Akkermansiaceae bacterium]